MEGWLCFQSGKGIREFIYYFMKNKHTDAIVVGAGAGGGVVAKELAVNGFQGGAVRKRGMG
jgi:ribulose 1,5-bisphosphate synthetase/thiazole synthase